MATTPVPVVKIRGATHSAAGSLPRPRRRPRLVARLLRRYALALLVLDVLGAVTACGLGLLGLSRVCFRPMRGYVAAQLLRDPHHWFPILTEGCAVLVLRHNLPGDIQACPDIDFHRDPARRQLLRC